MSGKSRPHLLLFGYRPPPCFGPSTACETLLGTSFARDFAVQFLDLRMSDSLRDLERLQWRKLVRALALAWRTWRVLRQHRFDLCLYPVAWSRLAFLRDALLLGLARQAGVRTVLWVHGTGLTEFRAGAPRWQRRWIDHTLRGAAAVIVLGKQLRDEFRPLVPDDRILVAPLGVDAPALAPAATGPMVLYLGGLIREKGIFTLLASVPAVLARQPRTQFVFAGEWTLPRDREEAEQLVQMLRVTEAVQFLGVVVGTAKWELLARSSVLALPTFYAREALPNVLLEALAASLPVVTTRRGAISEVIEDGVNGLLVAEQDAGDLADKLAALLADPDRRALMARVNRAKYERAFTAEHFAARMADLMRQTNAR